MNRVIFQWTLFACLAFVSSSFAQQTAAPPAQQEDMGAILVKGLRAVDGCLQVKTCEWDDGKQSIVAWFENKKAATAWFHSPTHQAMIGGKTDGSIDNMEPMQYLEDENQPIMVIASLTPAAKPELAGMNIPISQISVELFAPLPGGALIGGRVSPPTFHVPHMRDYTPSPTD